jgi:hypothetical protein
MNQKLTVEQHQQLGMILKSTLQNLQWTIKMLQESYLGSDVLQAAQFAKDGLVKNLGDGLLPELAKLLLLEHPEITDQDVKEIYSADKPFLIDYEPDKRSGETIVTLNVRKGAND